MELNALLITGAAFLSITLILAVFTVRIRDGKKIKEMWAAYGIQFIIMGLIFVPAYFGGVVFLITIAGIATFSLIEYLDVHRDLPRVLKPVCVVFGVVILGLAHFFSFPIVYLSIPPAAAVLLILSLFFKSEDVLSGIAHALVGLIYIPLFFAHLLLIRKMDHGFLLIFYLYGIAEINDSFAYVVGRYLGKKKIFPNISPRKTYAGFISGVLAAGLAALMINVFVTHFAPLFAALAATVSICFTVVGDLVSSRIKRALRIKDFSTRIPGMGGILDIYDSLLFVAPFIFFLAIFVRKLG